MSGKAGRCHGKTFTLTYDDHGNLIRKQNAADPSEQTLYIWDPRNRLATIAMQEGGNVSTAAFKYDALSRRIERTVSQAGGSAQRTQFVYDGIQAIGELVDGRLAATILTGLNIDEVIARTVNASGGQNPTATKTYLTDALGSVLAIARQDQSPETFYAYSAYGETQVLGVDPDAPANSSQYTARENDGLVGGTNGGSLYYYRARYYDPVLKRFIAEDLIGLLGGLNSYGYVNGDPVLFIDPLGLASLLTGKVSIGMQGGFEGTVAGMQLKFDLNAGAVEISNPVGSGPMVTQSAGVGIKIAGVGFSPELKREAEGNDITKLYGKPFRTNWRQSKSVAKLSIEECRDDFIKIGVKAIVGMEVSFNLSELGRRTGGWAYWLFHPSWW